jgi:hypothetical protein
MSVFMGIQSTGFGVADEQRHPMVSFRSAEPRRAAQPVNVAGTRTGWAVLTGSTGSTGSTGAAGAGVTAGITHVEVLSSGVSSSGVTTAVFESTPGAVGTTPIRTDASRSTPRPPRAQLTVVAGASYVHGEVAATNAAPEAMTSLTVTSTTGAAPVLRAVIV